MKRTPLALAAVVASVAFAGSASGISANRLVGSTGPDSVARQAQHVRAVLQDLISRGVAARRHVFF